MVDRYAKVVAEHLQAAASRIEKGGGTVTFNGRRLPDTRQLCSGIGVERLFLRGLQLAPVIFQPVVVSHNLPMP